MKMFLAGGTGAIGRYAVPALVDAGHEVTAVARNDEKAQWLASQGTTPVQVSIFDSEALASAVAGHDAVVNIATRVPPMSRAARRSAWAEHDRIRREGSVALAAAAREAGVGRFVQEAITFTYADRADAWIDEDVPFDVPDPFGTAVPAEEAVRRFTEAGGTGVVLRFASFYGPGSEQTEVLARWARRHLAFLVGRPDDYVSSIHLADAGAAVAAALSAPAGTYNVVEDEPVTKRRLAAIVGEAVGARPWVHVPGRLTPLVLRGQPAAGLLARSHRVSNARFREATGWAPQYPSAREGWAAPDMPGRAGPAGAATPGPGTAAGPEAAARQTEAGPQTTAGPETTARPETTAGPETEAERHD
jgi:nucleoside-diphosphate-sugar epimerase